MNPSPNPSSPATPSGARALGAPASRPLWRRVLLAQEFGLVVVILLLSVGLIAGTHFKFGPIQSSDLTTIENATVDGEGDDAFAVVQGGGSGARTVYRYDQGYDFKTPPVPAGTAPKVILRHTYSVNKFLNRDNLISVLTSSAFIAIMAVGMTGVIVMGGIDLSVGSIYALAIVLGAMAIEPLIGVIGDRGAGEASPLGAILLTLVVCVGTGMACGLVNGIGTVGLRVHPFIITLGGMALYRGIAFVITKGQTVGPFPESYTASFGKLPIFGGTLVPTLMMLAVAIAGAFVLSRTVFGRRAFAIGGNEVAAKYAGIPVGRSKVMLFVTMGGLAGLAAALYVGYFGSGGPDAGKGYELNVIAATVVGGASLSGGRGTALGAVMGAVIIQLIDNGILLLGVNGAYRDIVIGAAIVAAVVVDQTKQRVMK